MADIISLENKKSGELELPKVFSEEVRPDLIKRAFLAEQSHSFQLKYTDPLAGKRKAVVLMKTRRTYKTSYGHGMNRTPRKTVYHLGTHFQFIGAFAPHTVGGREAHPPVSERVIVKKINKKERNLAIRSAIAASARQELVSKYHRLSKSMKLPLIVDDSINSVSKTKEIVSALNKIGLGEEMSRVTKRKIRAGKGKLRGRKYKKKLGPILVTTDDSKLRLALRNVNVSVKTPDKLTVSDASHSGMPGRLIIWTAGAISAMEKMNDGK